MRRELLRTGIVAALATVALGIALVLPIRHGRVLDVYVLGLGALALLGAVAATRAAAPEQQRSGFERALHRSVEERKRPAELARLEREVYLAAGNGFHFHARLRRALRETAAHRLRERRGIELDVDRERAAAVLGPETWELLDPERPEPRNRSAPGIALARLRAAVESLERI